MRQKRAKQYRKQIQILKNTFKFKTPIQCLVDDNLILEATNASYDLIKGINSVVQTETKFFVTQCCINHLYESKNQLAIDLAKRMEKRRCGHKDNLSSFECIKSITNIDGENKYRYLIATQDENLRTSLRNIAGVPLVFLHRSVLVLEPFSKVTRRVVEAVERMKLTQGLNSIDAGKRKLEGADDNDAENDENSSEKPKHKKKKVKGVNPLAMKKKQKKPQQPQQQQKEATEEEETAGKKKRRRQRHSKTETTADETTTSSEVVSEVPGKESEPFSEKAEIVDTPAVAEATEESV